MVREHADVVLGPSLVLFVTAALRDECIPTPQEALKAKIFPRPGERLEFASIFILLLTNTFVNCNKNKCLPGTGLTPVIPALWEAKMSRSRGRSLRPAWPIWQNAVSTKNTEISLVW